MPDTTLSLDRRGGGLTQFQYLYNDTNTVPVYYYGENSYFRFFIKGAGVWGYAASGSVTIGVSLGSPGRAPLRGEWRLGTGAATGTAVSFNATTTQLLNAISGVYGNVSITTYGSAITAGYLISAATANTALTITGQSLSLTPSSTVEVLDLVSPATGVTAQKLVRLRRKPAVAVTAYLNTASLSGTSISASGASSTCGPWFVTIPDDAKRYPQMTSVRLSLSGAVTTTDDYSGFFYSNETIDNIVDGPGGSRGRVSSQLLDRSFVTTSSAGGFVAQSTTVTNTGVTYYGNRISDFVTIRTERWLNNGFKITVRPVTSGIVTSVTLGGDSDQFMIAQGIYNVGVITFTGPDLDEAFREARQDVVTLTLEVTLEENGQKTVLLQSPATVVRNIA